MSLLTAYDKFIQVALKYAFSLFGLPKTGQTTSYKTGDDGTYQKGYPKTITRFTDNGDGTVTDNATGLMWEQKTDDAGIHDKDTTYSWNDAFDVFIAALNAGAGFAGHTDWRLPNVRELGSLTDFGKYNLAINAVFTTLPYYTKSAYYWSSTARQDVTTSKWIISTYTGYRDYKDTALLYYARAVRGG